MLSKAKPNQIGLLKKPDVQDKYFTHLDMKIAILLSVFVAVVVARPEEDLYSKYEYFDVKEVITNQRLLKAYSHCFLGKEKCTSEGKDFKKLIPEAVRTECVKCSEKQKSLLAQVIKAVVEQLPVEWEELSKEYNPNGVYTVSLNQFLEKYANN
ncbi:unnamed protein product [Parnassius apollo]|uniref:(apollo) hypothetical protein n=1 Tax=Parnassius apollo TaxID=110799 RepID=A0A8S3YC24_PARAO|nr:unnamed protein product [Parnassius apollo]